MIKSCSCNRAKVYFGSVWETLIHGQLSLSALWWRSDYGGSEWQGSACLKELGMQDRRGWDSDIPSRGPPWHSVCEVPLP